MNAIIIQGRKRESVGKSATRALRKAEQVPCVVYGGDTNIQFSTPVASFKKLVYTPEVYTVVIEWDAESKKASEKVEAVLQDVQFHPVSDEILHADFYQLHKDKPIILSVPIKTTGHSTGVAKGGEYSSSLKKLKVKALPADLPNHIYLDITPLEIGDRISVKDICIDKYTILHPDNTVVATVRASRTSMKIAQAEAKEEKKDK
ncbi:MAG: 50S ribosomal protein L25/general stress protein Ctc [Flavobacteriales bacterium AspAUS03]